MKIEKLPVEILMKIFSYLPRYEEVSLVNKLFYDVACKVHDPNTCLRIDKRFSEQHWLPSIRNSTRQISKVDVSFSINQKVTQLPIIISIIRKFGASIKYLSFVMFSLVSMTEFLEILSLVPNVEKLVLGDLQLRAENQPCKKKTYSNDDLDLHQLKKFYFWCQSPDFLAVFNRLPLGVLKELYIQKSNLNSVTMLFKRQTNIKELVLDLSKCEATITADIFDNLKLESLDLLNRSYNNFNIAQVLSKQTQLKSLELDLEKVDLDVMNFVGNLTELDTLTINVNDYDTPSAASITKLSKLEKLKDLSLVFFDGTCQLEQLAKLHNPRITTLNLNAGLYEPNLIHALAKSVPNLKVLQYDSDISSKLFNAITRSFNFVEVLVISGEFNADMNQLNEGDCFNPKLMVLIIINAFTCETTFLNKLIADYPNLKKLEILSGSAISTTQFRQILNGFTKLDSLNLCDASGLTMDDLNYLQDRKNNLNFITLGCLNIKVTDELKRQLSATFGVIIFDGKLHMAVNRSTMMEERRF